MRKGLFFYIFIAFFILIEGNAFTHYNRDEQVRERNGLSDVYFDGGIFFPMKALSGPASGYNVGFGYGAGVEAQLIDFLPRFRLDVAHYEWTKNGQSYRRVPFFIGFRFPLRRDLFGFFSDDRKYGMGLLPYVELGLEVSVDGGENGTRTGFAPGAGLIEFRIDKVRIGADVRYHLIKYSYFSLMPYIKFEL